MPNDRDLLLKLINERIGVLPSAAERFEGVSRSPEAQTDGQSEGIVYLEGPIVDALYESFYEDWYGEGVVTSRKSFRARLDAIEGNVMVRVNSPGGDVWEATAMRQMLLERQESGDEINVMIEGLCASAATLVIASCDKIEMTDMSSYMIHRASSFMYGNGDEFIRWGEHMTGLDSQMAGIYDERMDEGKESILEMMTKETWFTAEEAVEAGIVDAVATSKKKDDDPPVDSLVQARNLRMSQLDSLNPLINLPSA